MKTNTGSDELHGSTSNGFIAKYAQKISGFLEGFDRLRLRGTLRSLYCPTVLEAYLCAQHVKFKDFGEFAERTTNKLKAAAEALAEKLARPVVYVGSSGARKEDIAREIARRDGVQEGLIGVFKSVEPCQAYSIRRQPEGPGFEFRLEVRKCLYFYFYFEHPRFGFMHLRLQSWLPFQVDVCLNGRHWLGRQLDQAGIAYGKRENAIVWVEDVARAQGLLDQQMKTDWHRALNELLSQVHPTAAEICRPLKLEYYWSASESEYASDVLFAKPEALARIYPSLVHHAVRSFGSADVMRFLGRKVPLKTGRVAPQFKGEIISDLKHRPEGIRVKHQFKGNSIKIYDKHGSVLRVETTINRPVEFRVYRRAQKQSQSGKSWRVLRRNVSDLPRRAQISQRANHRYLQALAAVSGTIPLFEWTEAVCRPIRRAGRRHRALNPLGARDGALLEIVNRGEFALNGFRNRDVRARLYPRRTSRQTQRRQANAVTRQLVLLRAHGLIAKVSRTHRYIVTEKGRATITALLSARRADVDQLTALAA
jgi:hypothetical protein